MTKLTVPGKVLRITEATGNVAELGMNKFTRIEGMILLLPYCSKKPSCSWRQKQGCVQCGECTIGEAYQLAADNGMVPISINNFEELMEVLNDYKLKDCPGFLGCCCEPFYNKHRQDFLDIGLPGILIDIDNTTCYELGKDKDAKAGKYKRQTNLKLSLLRKVIDKLVNSCETDSVPIERVERSVQVSQL